MIFHVIPICIVLTYLKQAIARCGEELRARADDRPMDLELLGPVAKDHIGVLRGAQEVL